MDHYYSAVDEILRRQPMDEVEVCTKLNFCYFGEEPTQPANNKPDSKHAVKPTYKWPERKKEDLIKVVQMTDIHIDPEYREGSSTGCGLYLCCRDKYDGTGSAGRW